MELKVIVKVIVRLLELVQFKLTCDCKLCPMFLLICFSAKMHYSLKSTFLLLSLIFSDLALFSFCVL